MDANKSYLLCETTSPGLKPGLIPTEIANTNYWRLSLKNR
jgi:hypothetical protein